MNLRMLGRIVCLVGIAAAFGCNAVYVTQPVGRDAVAIKPEEWNGDWSIPGQSQFRALVTDAEAGELVIAGVEEKDGKLDIDTAHLTLRPANEDGEWLVTLTDDDKTTGDPKRFVFAGLLKRHENHAILWSPRPREFSARIDEKKLPGTPGGGDDAYLGEIDASQIDMITSPALTLLGWKEPAFILKVN